MSDPLDVTHLGMRFGRTWALRDCSFSLPAGRIAALVGPNGAGKTTLLRLATGLLRPTEGQIVVCGRSPGAEPEAVLPRVGFVAQDHPLYRGFTVAETLTLGRKLNPGWNESVARRRLARLNIPLGKRTAALSGGQRAQIALLLALAKCPDLLLLDEPLASLDPLARREFLGVLMEAVAESGMTVLLSSHIVSDLERVCDYLIILAGGATQVAGDIEQIVGTHRRLTGPRREVDAIAHLHTIIEVQHTPRQTALLVRLNGPFFDPSWETQSVSLEDVVLAYLGRASGSTMPGATLVGDAASDRVEAGR